jgi:hypothetical protein
MSVTPVRLLTCVGVLLPQLVPVAVAQVVPLPNCSAPLLR